MIAMSLAICSLNPGAFTSGTQIVTGLKPAAFILSRCFWTRFAPSAMTHFLELSVTCNIGRERPSFKLRPFGPQNLDTGQWFAFHPFKKRAASGRNIGKIAGDPGLVQRRHG